MILVDRFKNKLDEYIRVFKITHKPNLEEFKGIIKISSIGIAIIGILGFIIHVAWNLIR